MMLVPTYLAPSPIHGTGIFAARPIARGEVLWNFMPALDRRVSRRYLEDFPGHIRAAMLHYGYVNPQRTDFVVICLDDARFWNFSPEPNAIEAHAPTAECEAIIIAARDIAAGEELTIGTGTDADAQRKLSHNTSHAI